MTSTPDPLAVYLTVREVMAITRIHRATFYRWIERGQLKAVQINGALRVHRNELDRIIRDYFEA